MRQDEQRVARAAGPSRQSSDRPRLLGRRAVAALAGLLGVLAFAGPAAASTAKKAPAGTSRDANGKLHDDASGQFANDPCAIREDDTDAMRAKLRRALACGPEEQAHHVIPLELRSMDELVAAGHGGWDINGKGNGICLAVSLHSGCHPLYTIDVRTQIVAARLRGLPPKQSIPKLTTLIDQRKRSLRSRRKSLK